MLRYYFHFHFHTVPVKLDQKIHHFYAFQRNKITNAFENRNEKHGGFTTVAHAVCVSVTSTVKCLRHVICFFAVVFFHFYFSFVTQPALLRFFLLVYARSLGSLVRFVFFFFFGLILFVRFGFHSPWPMSNYHHGRYSAVGFNIYESLLNRRKTEVYRLSYKSSFYVFVCVIFFDWLSVWCFILNRGIVDF